MEESNPSILPVLVFASIRQTEPHPPTGEGFECVRVGLERHPSGSPLADREMALKSHVSASISLVNPLSLEWKTLETMTKSLIFVLVPFKSYNKAINTNYQLAKLMKVFGLGYGGYHDSNIAVMEDGKILYAVSEERLSGIKKDGRFPFRAIESASKYGARILCVSGLQDQEFIQENKKANIRPSYKLTELRKRVFRHINTIARSFDEIVFYSHQDCHAASAFYFSGFENALVVTWDAGSISEPWNFTVQTGNRFGLKREKESTDGLPALNYAAVTALCGFKPERHEGKITGLAAYGKINSTESEKVEKMLNEYAKNSNLLEYITEWKNAGSDKNVPVLETKQSEVKKIINHLNISRENLASIIQHLTEEKVLKTIRELRNEYPKTENLCLAGGLFANVLINKKIKELGFKNVYIHPAMGDDGLALGACALYLSSKGINPEYNSTVFWGPDFTDKDIEDTINNSELSYYKSENIEKDVAEKLSKGQIVARFSGNMEYGPRSLGNRSILAAATNKDINDSLNKKLRRTEFMPFAPITTEENREIMFKNTVGLDKALKFMTVAVDCTEKCKKENPAITHIDGTARPQIVDSENMGLKRILQEYQKITGLRALINTSFNMHEGPIVCTPQNAIDTFKESKIDCLAIGSFIVTNND